MAVFWLSQVTAEQTYAASRTTTDLEKEKVEVSFCHCCHERMPTLNHDFVVDGMVRRRKKRTGRAEGGECVNKKEKED